MKGVAAFVLAAHFVAHGVVHPFERGFHRPFFPHGQTYGAPVVIDPDTYSGEECWRWLPDTNGNLLHTYVCTGQY